MTNKDIEAYNLSDEDKHRLRHLRNIRRRMKSRGRREHHGLTTKGAKRIYHLRDVQKAIVELQKNGGR